MVTERVHIDFETRSVAELARQNAVGEHAYAAHASTDPLLLAYKTPEMGSVAVLDLLDSTSLPVPIHRAIEAGLTFVAHNARFEQAIWYWQMHKRFGWPVISNWSCTAARARYWGLRASLDGAGSDLEIENKKNKRGEELIKIFCKPRKKIKGVIRQAWATPRELPNEWAEFKQYCGDDVLAEMDIDALLPDLPPFEQAVWDLDYTMNWRGLPLDMDSVHKAITYCEHFTNQAVERFNTLTGGINPTQRDRVLEYCNAREMELDNLQKKTLKRLNLVDFDPDLREIIGIRLETAQASVKKLQAMVRCTTGDGVARGLILYYGAHTGRDSGKRVQPQNFIRGNRRVQNAFFEYLEGWGDEWQENAELTLPKSPLNSLAQSMRGFIKAPVGKRIIAADYAQIEARVNAWLARDNKKLKAFRDGDDLYCRFAAVMYNRQYEDYFEYVEGKRKVLEALEGERQIAKSAELGCGFQMGGAAFVRYCDNMDIIITEERAKEVVSAWRGNNPEIVQLWSRMEKAAILAVDNEGRIAKCGPLSFTMHRIDNERYWLLCVLPSGRHIAYYRPKLSVGMQWGKPRTVLSFRTEWNGKTYREQTYGGMLTENAVQGIARDIMKVGVQNAESAGYEYILPVHDEGLFLCDDGFGSATELEELFCNIPKRLYGDLPVTAEGKEMVRYTK